MGYIEFFDRLAGMMESIGTHLSYLSEYSKPTFQESERLQEVRFKWSWNSCSLLLPLLTLHVRNDKITFHLTS